MSRTKASFSHLQLLEFEGYSHKSFVFTSSTVGTGRKSRKKASCPNLHLLDFGGRLAQRLRFHIFNCWNLKDVLHEMRF